jgi:hypothetical protein
MEKNMKKYKVQTKQELRNIIKEGKVNLFTLDVSNITNTSELFKDIKYINGSISEWDVSNVTDMSFMFD